MTSYIYHERQLGGLCGVHCLNNLLQGPHFGPGDLAEIGVQLDREEGYLLRGDVQYNVDSSADGGNFSIQVLAVALRRFQLELLPAKHPDARELMKDPPKAAEAFLCQYKDHWFAVREVGSCWWNLNSTRKRPGLVSGFHLAAWLGQLSAEGYSIFLVVGSTLPLTAQLPKESKPADPEENFHEIVDLLEWAKSGEDNPLAGGESASEETLPPEVLQEAQYGPPQPQPHVVFGTPLSFDGTAALLGLVGGGYGSASGSSASAGVGLASLREMGFREPQIQAALELSGGSAAQTAELLMKVGGADQVLENDSAKLAQALQDAVQALDTKVTHESVIVERVLRLVAVLCSGQDDVRLKAAKIVDPAGLTEFLISVLERQRSSWTPKQMRAANIALELLTTWPGGNLRRSHSISSASGVISLDDIVERRVSEKGKGKSKKEGSSWAKRTLSGMVPKPQDKQVEIVSL